MSNLFNFFKRNKITSTVNSFTSLIGSDTSVRGPISIKGSIQINGYVDGSILSDVGPGKTVVVVSSTGHVNGDIECDIMILEGHVHGNIKAREVCIHPSASFEQGHDIEYEIIQIMPGANVEAKLMKRLTVQNPRLDIPQTASDKE